MCSKIAFENFGNETNDNRVYTQKPQNKDYFFQFFLIQSMVYGRRSSNTFCCCGLFFWYIWSAGTSTPVATFSRTRSETFFFVPTHCRIARIDLKTGSNRTVKSTRPFLLRITLKSISLSYLSGH